MALLSDLTASKPEMASKAGPGQVDPYQPEGIVYGWSFTPVLTPGTNVTAQKLTTAKVLYTRVGPNVLVTGTIRAGSNAAINTTTKFYMNLPIPSDLGYALDLSGAGTRATASGIVSNPVLIRGDATGNRAEFEFNSTSAAISDLSFMFQYGII